MCGSVVVLFFLPWLDHSPVKSIRYRPTWHKFFYAIFIVDFLVLGVIGTKAPNATLNVISQIGTMIYLGFFLLMPVWRSEEHTSELQSLMRISYAVFCLKKKQNSIHP